MQMEMNIIKLPMFTNKRRKIMKKLIKSFKGTALLCALCLSVTTFWVPFYGSFLFLGEPEIPEALKE
jgi:hypothetical protein